MESGRRSGSESRAFLRDKWLQQEGYGYLQQPMAGDASTRQYFRLLAQPENFVLMDAPPDTNDCQQFASLAEVMRSEGLRAPEVFAANYEQGWMVITDFGQRTYLSTLNQENADRLYHYSLAALLKMQSSSRLSHLPLDTFAVEWMEREWQWHKKWFLQDYLGLPNQLIQPSLDQCMQRIIQSATDQPQVFMHRDYHAGNLMLLDNDVGILDFQDAFIGPVTYDLASLLRDCYIVWPDVKVTQWLEAYYRMQKPFDVLKGADFATLQRWFDWMGIQRHLKAIMTFSRKHLRDKQSGYLQHIPAALNYIRHVSAKYTEMKALNQFVCEEVMPALSQKREIA